MRLFKPRSDDELERLCPECRERVPEDAAACAMCGRELREATTSATASSAGDSAPQPPGVSGT